jgi:hypothetical protein
MMIYAQHIAAAMEQYGVSAVSDVIARMGNRYEAAALINIEAGMRLFQIAKFETEDQKTFRGRK